MNQREVEIVQKTFEAAAGLGEKVPEIFYAELFAIDPTLRNMFKGDMRAQGRKLLGALTMVVRGLDRPETIVPVAEKLAIKHLDYGVKYEHYTFVGNALLRTLKKGLGPDFTPETRAAWVSAFQLLADVMRAAAYDPMTHEVRKAG